MDGNRITKENLITKMKVLQDLYDVVRLVEPESTSVVTLGEHGMEEAAQEPCFSVWEKDSRCANCVSLRACLTNEKVSKFEFKKDEAYHVLAMPYVVEDGEHEYKVSLELVNRVKDNMILQADGVDEQSQQIMEINLKLYQDSLTGAYNRRYYDEYRYIYEKSHKLPKNIGYIVCDINHFKKINDHYGHHHGDELLAKTAEVLKLTVRSSDSVIRVGGDEFLVVLCDCEKQFVETKVDQLKRAVSKIRMSWLENVTPSIAVGMAYMDNFTGKKEELSALFEIGDKDMYADKKLSEGHSSGITVLVVDDVEMNRSFARKIIEKRYKVLEAANGVEALEIMNSTQIDIIVTDIFMDKMNGYELMKKVKAIPHFRDIPIIAVTENSEATQRKAIEAGADIYVDRPLGGYNLLDTIQKLTGRDHGRKELFDMDFVLETIPGAIIIYKVHGNEENLEIVSCSRGIGQLTGWDSDEFSHTTQLQNEQAIFPADLELFRNAMGRMIRTHSRAEIIYRGYKKDGSIVWIWFQGRYIGEEDGCPIIEAILLDVSNNTNMYQSIIDEAESAVTVVDAHTFEVLYVNKTATSLVGLKEADYIGKVCYECVFHKDKPCRNCIVNHKDREFMELELEIHGVPYRQIFRRILWHGVEAFLEYTTNIATEKENIAYAENQKNQQSQILNNIPVGIIVYCWKDNELTAVEANRNLYEMMHLSKARIVTARDDDFLALVYEDDKAMCKGIFEQLKIPDSDMEYEFRSLDRESNSYVWMSGRGVSVLQPDGSVFIYLAYRDITAKKELEKAQQALFEEKKSAEAKAEFYSQMSHDMRTPMNGILGLAELDAKEKNLERIHEDMEKIHQSGKYMLGLINDTLDLQRLETGRMVLEPGVVKSKELFADIMTMVSPAIEEKNIRFDFQVMDEAEDEMSWFVRLDTLRFKQVITNLLSNAVKFTPAGGRVILRLKETGRDGNLSHNSIEVTDTGIGMSQEFVQTRLFKPFSQEHNEMTEKYGGSGLGLSIVKKLVDLMGGRIEVSSELGEGTTFIVYLDVEVVPNDEASKLHTTLKRNEKENQHLIAGKRILLCEDHPLNAEIVMRLLKKVEVETDWAKDGAEGVERFTNAKPGYYSAVLMDIRMPRMDGLEAAGAIRALAKEDAKTIPIIAMSANAYESDVQKSFEAGMNGHIAKPVEAQVIYETLNRFVNGNTEK